MRIEITRTAEDLIAQAAAWWKENRLSAPGAVLDELDRVLGLLAVQPELGAKARRQPCVPGVRRVLLSRIHYYVYYRVTEEPLQVLAMGTPAVPMARAFERGRVGEPMSGEISAQRHKDLDDGCC